MIRCFLLAAFLRNRLIYNGIHEHCIVYYASDPSVDGAQIISYSKFLLLFLFPACFCYWPLYGNIYVKNCSVYGNTVRVTLSLEI